MAAERLDMRSVREILRLHFSCGQSPRQIAKLKMAEQPFETTSQGQNNNGLTTWQMIEPLGTAD